jgi:hypothetical protein
MIIDGEDKFLCDYSAKLHVMSVSEFFNLASKIIGAPITSLMLSEPSACFFNLDV